MNVVLPQVQLVGVQKSGTSALADWLFEHHGFKRPKVMKGEPDFYSKEVHFFDIDNRFCKGLKFYSSRFSSVKDTEWTMDATPDTLGFPERVHQLYKSVGQESSLKIIVILREPVSRELSLYNHLAFEMRNLSSKSGDSWCEQVLDKNGSVMTFDEFVQNVSIPSLVNQEKGGRSSRYGMYAFHLAKWFRFFARKQILVLSYAELTDDPKKLQERIQNFLGLPDISTNIPVSNSLDGPSKVKSPSPQSREALTSIFAPMNEELYRLLESNPGPSMEQRPFPRF